MRCHNVNYRNKKGSAMMMILVLFSAFLIMASALMNNFVKTMQLNNKYNEDDNLKLAAESSLNIAKSQLLKSLQEENGDVIYLSELPEKYDFTKKVNEVIGNEDGVKYTAVAILDQKSGVYSLETTATDKEGNVSRDIQKIQINMNIGEGISPIVDKGKALCLLGKDAKLTVKIIERGKDDDFSPYDSLVPTDVWYVQSNIVDLNSRVNVRIPKNTIIGTNINAFDGITYIENTGVRKTYFNKNRVDLQKEQLPFKENGEMEYIRDREQNDKIIGYSAKLEDGTKVLAINGNYDIVGDTAEFKDTLIYVAGKLTIGTVHLIMDNSMIVAGQELVIDSYSLTIKNNPNFSNKDKIKEFLIRYTR